MVIIGYMDAAPGPLAQPPPEKYRKANPNGKGFKNCRLMSNRSLFFPTTLKIIILSSLPRLGNI